MRVREGRRGRGVFWGGSGLLFIKTPEKKSCKIFFNQSLIDPDQFFNQDPDRDEKFSTRVRQKFFNHGLVEKNKSRTG